MEDECNVFVVMWCSEGLECVVPVSELHAQEVIAKLVDPEARITTVSGIIGRLLLRAQFNEQRFYEIYSVSAVDGITADDITALFEADPQAGANLIRERGQVIRSYRREKAAAIT